MSQRLSKIIIILLVVSVGLNIYFAYGIMANNQETTAAANENKLNVDADYFLIGSNSLSESENGYEYQFELVINRDVEEYINHPYIWQNYGLNIVLHFGDQSIEYSRTLDVYLDESSHLYTIEIDSSVINDDIITAVNNQDTLYSVITVMNVDTDEDVVMLVGNIE